MAEDNVNQIVSQDVVWVDSFDKKSEENKEVLARAVNFLQKDVESLLKERLDRQAQEGHLQDVLENSSAILRDLYERELTEEEVLEIKLFEYAHDRGKWDQKRAEQIMSSDQWEQVVEALGLSPAELSILEKAKEGSPALKDLAHHMYSVILWAADCMDENKLGALPEEVKEKVKTAILEHHFEGYYKGVAERHGFSNEEIAAVVRKPGISEFSQACHDGDLLSMTQIGNSEGEEFKLGGYLKIVLLSARFGLNGSNPNVQNLEDAFRSADTSVRQVNGELVTEKGREMYGKFAPETEELRQAVLADAEFSALKAAFEPGLSFDDQKILVEQLKLALIKHGKEIVKRRIEEERSRRLISQT
ncbi:MAG: hypothetical protein NZM26_03040 [Patescibacteria group bacterium]|nr:hypothetical protein [Patescibacteria group bacterium]